MTTHSFGETSTYLLPTKKDENLLVRKWNAFESPKGVIIAIHGGMAHSGDWELPAQFYNQKGYELHALDLPGHGTYAEINPGKKNLLDIENFDIYVEHVHDLVSSLQSESPDLPIYIFGHSMGGLIALLYGVGLGKDQKYIRGFGISAPWLKNKTKSPVPVFIINLLARFLPTLAIPLKIDLSHLTHDEAVLKRHQIDIDCGLRGGMATPRFALISQRAQDHLEAKLLNWNDYPLAVAIAGMDRLADPQFTRAQMDCIKSPVIQYRYYENNLHENFNEVNRQDVFQYIFDSLQM
ncbi:MAG: lysophospholipase [Glaciecola sp.]|jgi:lysophospholipase